MHAARIVPGSAATVSFGSATVSANFFVFPKCRETSSPVGAVIHKLSNQSFGMRSKRASGPGVQRRMLDTRFSGSRGVHFVVPNTGARAQTWLGSGVAGDRDIQPGKSDKRFSQKSPLIHEIHDRECDWMTIKS